MSGLIERFYAAPNRIQDGVLFLLLEAAIYLAISFFDLYHGNYVYTFSAGVSFLLEMAIIVSIILCGLGLLYGMKAGWIGSVILSVILMAIGIIFMVHNDCYTLTLSGLFYFIFGILTFIELMRKTFRRHCGLAKPKESTHKE